MELTQAILREWLTYSHETGEFRWSKQPHGGPRKAGDLAGSKLPIGYWAIRLQMKLYYAHRLAWLYMTGEWPAEEVDHINGNPLDNSWRNLRAATSSQNKINRRPSSRDLPKGVYAHKASGLYHAKVQKSGRVFSLGYHKTPELAHAAYRLAAEKVHGEFARFT